MTKIWIRLGGFITANSENERLKIMSGDKGVLMSVIRRNGFELNGESYIPSEGEETQDVDFDFNGGKILK